MAIISHIVTREIKGGIKTAPTKVGAINKLQQFFSHGLGKRLSLEEAAQYINISYDELVDLTFQFGIPYHVDAKRELYYYKHTLSRWVFENPTVLLRVRSKIKKRGQGVFK